MFGKIYRVPALTVKERVVKGRSSSSSLGGSPADRASVPEAKQKASRKRKRSNTAAKASATRKLSRQPCQGSRLGNPNEGITEADHHTTRAERGIQASQPKTGTKPRASKPQATALGPQQDSTAKPATARLLREPERPPGPGGESQRKAPDGLSWRGVGWGAWAGEVGGGELLGWVVVKARTTARGPTRH